jgi:hypothetical protein
MVLIISHKLVFSQNKKVDTKRNPNLSKEIKYDSMNIKLHEAGKIMESKFLKSEIKTDKEIEQKSFIIERTSNIKINVVNNPSKS